MKRFAFRGFNRGGEGESVLSKFKKLDFESKIILSVFIGSILFIGVGVAAALEPNELPERSVVHNQKEHKDIQVEEVPSIDKETIDDEKKLNEVEDQEEPKEEEVLVTEESEDDESNLESENVSPRTYQAVKTDSVNQGNSTTVKRSSSVKKTATENSNTTAPKKPQKETEGETEKDSANNETVKEEQSEIPPQVIQKPEEGKESDGEQQNPEAETPTEPAPNGDTEKVEENKENVTEEPPVVTEPNKETSLIQ